MHPLSGALIEIDGTLPVQLAIFLVALVLFNKVIFKPLMSVFEAREQAIDGRRAEARRMVKEADDRGIRYEEALRKLRMAAADERERLRQDGLRLERNILDKVRSDMQQKMRDAERSLASEGRAVREDVDKAIPGLARAIATKLMGREV